ncbi:MAG: hypothetical protein R3E79_02745 [Caldilineaceae bacterium]
MPTQPKLPGILIEKIVIVLTGIFMPTTVMTLGAMADAGHRPLTVDFYADQSSGCWNGRQPWSSSPDGDFYADKAQSVAAQARAY